MENKITRKCLNKCWCSICSNPIERLDDMILKHKRGWKAVGLSRFNICPLCIEKAFKELNKKQLKKIKLRLVLNKI